MIIKDKESFFNLFKIFKKTNDIKDKLNKDELKYFNQIKKIKNKELYLFKGSNHKIILVNFISAIIVFISVYYKESGIKGIFLKFFEKNFFDHFIFFYSLFYLISALLFFMTSVFLLYNTLCYFYVKLLKYKYNYKLKEKEYNNLIFFNDIIYFFKSIKNNEIDINQIILSFNEKDINTIKEHNFDFFDNKNIYNSLIKFLQENFIKEQNFEYNEFKKEIEYLLKNIDYKINFNEEIKETLNKLKLINKFNLEEKIENKEKIVYNF